MYGYNLKGEKIKIETPEEVINLLCEVSPIFKEALKSEKTMVLKLHSCNTGADDNEEGSSLSNPIAQQISDKYKNVIVIAPDGKVVMATGKDPKRRNESDENVYEKGVYDKDGEGSYRWFYRGKEFKRDNSVALEPNPDQNKSQGKSKDTKLND